MESRFQLSQGFAHSFKTKCGEFVLEEDRLVAVPASTERPVGDYVFSQTT